MSNSNLQISKNEIIIPKSEFNRLKKDFGFFAAFIDTNFSNSKDYFKNGNYILKKDLLPAEMTHYDEPTDTEYIIERNDVWKALPGALMDYHVPDRVLGDYMASFFIFKTHKNSLFNPTIAEQQTVPKLNGFFIAQPSRTQLKKTRRKQRNIRLLREDLGEGNNANLPLFYKPLSNENLEKILRKEKRVEEISKLKSDIRARKIENVRTLAERLQNIYRNKQKIARAIYLTEKGTANRTKYTKQSATRKKSRGETEREKRRTQRRMTARIRKEMRSQPMVNNESMNNENINNENLNE